MTPTLMICLTVVFCVGLVAGAILAIYGMIRGLWRTL